MSSTRRAKPGSPLNQSKYCSSPEYQSGGLLGNPVAQRCSVLERPEDREIVYFLQYLTHRIGIKQTAENLLARFQHRLGTASMRELGIEPGRVYGLEEAKAVRAELDPVMRCRFPLHGDFTCSLAELISDDFDNAADRHPESYPAGVFFKECKAAAFNLDEDLKIFCLNPNSDLEQSAPWYFADLPACVREYQQEWISSHVPAAETKLGQEVRDTLDYALETKCMVLIEGLARMGKTFAAQTWCEQHPGRARYVQVPSTNDEVGFFRAIAKALGLSCGLGWKAIQLRERIEDVLHGGDLAIVFDEAHYLFGSVADYRHVLPGRINWIMTSLVNQGVPVALVTTPQFLHTRKIVETRTKWTSEQFTGRLGHYQRLPESLSEEDLQKVAIAILPEGDERSIEILVRYAQSSAKYVAGIETAVRRAKYLAARDGRSKATSADIRRAIKEAVIPSDSALAEALADPGSKRPRKTRATPLQPAFTQPERHDFAGGSSARRAAESDSDLARVRRDIGDLIQG